MQFSKFVATAALVLILVGSSPARADILYSVRTGDTLDSIATQHGLKTEQVLQANPGLKTDVTHLEEGLLMVLPVQEDRDLATESSAPAPMVVRIPGTDSREDEASRAGDRHRANQLASRRGSMLHSILGNARRFMGTPYSMGATGNGAFDCSGFVMRIFSMQGIRLPRTADVQYSAGQKVPRGQEQPGDLVFFETYLPGPSHVGIYVGNGNFIHASSSRGVTVSNLEDSYYKPRYLGAKRVF
ncbi:MAG: LysM peptidoglycan-binding domain-containing C40 family peptidase [Burkholderiales bacterium]|nr:LysM peptidoglycan-binding domain-containing C40 family peptidase [Burkholderiales bacterium]